MAIDAFGLTDVGRKRRHNEDAYLMDVDRGLFVVADGMGGHAAGEVASRITVESIQEFIAGTEEEHENTWPFGFNNRYSLEGNRLTTAVEKANERVMRAVQNRPELKGMGTTVVAALFDADRVTLVHVGDSRAYLFRSGELKRLTDDHSWVQEQVNAGILSEDEAKTHPLKNVVTRALGGSAHVAVDLIEVPTSMGDRFLLCSDGLTGMVTDDEIVDHLRSGKVLEEAVRALIALANERGGVDNVTCIVVHVAEIGTPHTDRKPAPIVKKDLGEQTAVTLTAPTFKDPNAAPPVAEPPTPPIGPAPVPAPNAAPAAVPAPAAPATPSPVPTVSNSAVITVPMAIVPQPAAAAPSAAAAPPAALAPTASPAPASSEAPKSVAPADDPLKTWPGPERSGS